MKTSYTNDGFNLVGYYCRFFTNGKHGKTRADPSSLRQSINVLTVMFTFILDFIFIIGLYQRSFTDVK